MTMMDKEMKHIIKFLLIICVSAFGTQSVLAQCFGKVYHQRLDDLTWENEYCAYRAYGPALQQHGERAYGYDIWVKNTHDTIVDLRYRLHFPPKGSGIKRKSFHEDWGNGMDKYDVGPSLGCCTAALLDKHDSIVFPWCWQQCEILDAGPEKFKVHLTYKPTLLPSGKSYTEHRLISCQRGQRFNRCEVWYEGLDEPRKIAVGIVVHPANTDTLRMDKKHHYIAYVDLQNQQQVKKDGSDGVIYIGAYCPQATEYRQSQNHLLAVSTLKPGKHYVYWFGATWSKLDVHSFPAWCKLMERIGKSHK